MYKIIITVILSIFISSNALATRGYVGKNPISGVHVLDSSVSCGPSNGACLLLVFEGGALGCNPESGSISVSLNEPNFELIQSTALVSLTSKKKFRTYAAIESCGDAETLNPNGAGVYD
ncbi:hypothetical protein FKG94_22715 [Exilibacterium tricleocarpae]|uniref:Uncharacterized protein n=1 Tax=Exilibacterium tricleocarpae TaxID=2591008 RepID=A0A545SXC2_9GAMM|nr:hypothetical protein [Exilibacterium tricleocarpae]TQV69610.1 hypothetical protein FKG94_22715 [Exilibacterium tricleocarpae]